MPCKNHIVFCICELKSTSEFVLHVLKMSGLWAKIFRLNLKTYRPAAYATTQPQLFLVSVLFREKYDFLPSISAFREYKLELIQ